MRSITRIRCAALACIVGSAFVSTSALAAEGQLASSLSPGTAVLVAETPTLDELAASQANLNALARPVEHPPHRLPDGGLTSAPGQATLAALPTLASNVNVQNAFSSVKSFVGIRSSDNVTANGYEVEPPDQGLAVNNNIAVEINNNVLRVFNATTGVNLLPGPGLIATSVFFAAPAGSLLTDTQAFYDPTVGRWFLTEIIFNNSNGNNVDVIAVAVSQTSNAKGPYFIYHVAAVSKDLAGCQNLDCFPDYPKAGYDANIFIVDVDLFSTNGTNTSTGPFVAVGMYAMPKSKLIAGAGFTYVRFVDANDFVVQPSIPAPREPFVTAANGTEYLMTARGNGVVRVFAISNTNNIVSSPSSLRANFTDVVTQSYGAGTVPSTEPNVPGPYCSPYNAPMLEGGYSAFQATVQKAGGNLFGALAFGAMDSSVPPLNRDVIAWFELAPSVTSSGVPSATVVRQGTVVPPNGYSISYPAFGLDKSGAGAMGMTITNMSQNVVGGFPSAAYLQFTGTVFAPPSIFVSGPGFISDDGFTGCGGGGALGRLRRSGGRCNNWRTATNWGTFITQLR